MRTSHHPAGVRRHERKTRAFRVGCVLGRDDRGSDSIVVDSMSDDEAEKAAGEWEERQENTFWYESVYHVAYMAFMAGRKDGVEWERKKLLELARSHTTICGDPYFEMQLNRLIDRKEGGE